MHVIKFKVAASLNYSSRDTAQLKPIEVRFDFLLSILPEILFQLHFVVFLAQ